MKKYILVLASIIFTTCFVAGFGIAPVIWNVMLPQKAVAIATTNTPIPFATYQKNYAIIHVDNTENPTYLSIWGLFTNLSDTPGILFKPLYSSAQQTGFNQSIPGNFPISSTEDFSPEFRAILNQYRVEWNGFIVLDSPTLPFFFQSLSGQENSPVSGLQNYQNFAEELSIVRDSCTRINSPGNLPTSTIAQLKTNSPHIISDSGFAAFLESWKNVLSSRQRYCEVIFD